MREFYFSYILEVIQIVILLAAAPVFIGWVRTLKCWFQGRTTAGIFQPYRDLIKLFNKDVVLAENASWIFRVTPYLVFGLTVLIGAIIPVLSVDLLYSPRRHGYRHCLWRDGVKQGDDYRVPC